MLLSSSLSLSSLWYHHYYYHHFIIIIIIIIVIIHYHYSYLHYYHNCYHYHYYCYHHHHYYHPYDRFLAGTKQLNKWYFLSVCPSVRLSWLCSHYRIIMKFSGVIPRDQGKVHAKGQGQMSKVKVTEVTTQLNRFRAVTPVWIHIWLWNDTYSLILLRKGALLFLKVTRQISRSHSAKDR